MALSRRANLGGKEMKSLRIPLIAAAALAVFSLMSTGAEAGCARWGASGYHFYRSCVGPRFLYPHRRQCYRDGFCAYR
jgi:hypothetical protein